jgi:recombination protein RecR
LRFKIWYNRFVGDELAKVIPDSVQKLIDEFAKLPGIGEKTAGRLTFYLLNSDSAEVSEFGHAVLDLTKNIKKCSICSNITEDDPCLVCSDKSRDQSIIAVVERPLDVVALEKTGEYNGLYHILGGAISPVDGIGPENLTIDNLIRRVEKNKEKIKEIILATNPSLEGEATAMYLQKKLSPYKIKLTRIARGLPVGGDLEYADEITLQRALEGRKEY